MFITYRLRNNIYFCVAWGEYLGDVRKNGAGGQGMKFDSSFVYIHMGVRLLAKLKYYT